MLNILHPSETEIEDDVSKGKYDDPSYQDAVDWCNESHVQLWINNLAETESLHEESTKASLSSIPTSDDEMEVGVDAHQYNQQQQQQHQQLLQQPYQLSPRLSPLHPSHLLPEGTDTDNVSATNLSAVSGGSSLRDLNARILEKCQTTDTNKDVHVENVGRLIQRDDSGSLRSFESGFSVDNPSSLAAVLQPNPEEVLLNLGFGGSGENSLLHTVPLRFLQQPSMLPGIDVDAFQRSLISPEANGSGDSTSSILRRFSNDSISCDSYSIHSTTPADFRRVLFKSSHANIPSIHLSYDADCVSSPGASSVENNSSLDGTQRTRLSTLAELPEPLSRRSSFEEEVALAFGNEAVIDAACKILSAEEGSSLPQDTCATYSNAIGSTPQEISAMYSNVLVPSIKRSDSEKSCNSNVTVVPNPMSDKPVLVNGSTITESLFKPIDPVEATLSIPASMNPLTVDIPSNVDPESLDLPDDMHPAMFTEPDEVNPATLDISDQVHQERFEPDEVNPVDISEPTSAINKRTLFQSSVTLAISSMDDGGILRLEDEANTRNDEPGGIPEIEEHSDVVKCQVGRLADEPMVIVADLDDGLDGVDNVVGSSDGSATSKIIWDINSNVDDSDDDDQVDGDIVSDGDDVDVCHIVVADDTDDREDEKDQIDVNFDGEGVNKVASGEDSMAEEKKSVDVGIVNIVEESVLIVDRDDIARMGEEDAIVSEMVDMDYDVPHSTMDIDMVDAGTDNDLDVSNVATVVDVNAQDCSDHELNGIAAGSNVDDNDLDYADDVGGGYNTTSAVDHMLVNSKPGSSDSSPSGSHTPSVDDGIGLSHSQEFHSHADFEVEGKPSTWQHNIITIHNHTSTRTYSVTQDEVEMKASDGSEQGDLSMSSDHGNDTQKIIEEIREILSRSNSNITRSDNEKKSNGSDDEMQMINDIRNILQSSRLPDNEICANLEDDSNTQPGDRQIRHVSDYLITEHTGDGSTTNEQGRDNVMSDALSCCSTVGSTENICIDSTNDSDGNRLAALEITDKLGSNTDKNIDNNGNDSNNDNISEVVVINETELHCMPVSDAEARLVSDTISDNDDLALNDAFKDFFMKLKQDSGKEKSKRRIEYIEDEMNTKCMPEVVPQKTDILTEQKCDTENRKSARNYFAAAFHSLAAALGKYQDARPSKSTDKIYKRNKHIPESVEEHTEKPKTEKTKIETQNPRKRNFFSLFNQKPYDMQIDDFSIVAANIIEGKVDLDPIENEVEIEAVEEETKEADEYVESSSHKDHRECTEARTETQYCSNCRINQNYSSRSSIEKTPTRLVPISGYCADSPVTSDEDDYSSRTKRKRYVAKSLKKGASVESSGFDEGSSKQRCLLRKKNEASPPPPDILPITRKIEQLMNNAKSCLEQNSGEVGEGGHVERCEYFSPGHFEYVIQQLTRVRTEINAHFDEQAKRESELKTLLNEQVNEMKQIMTSEYMHRLSRDLDSLKLQLKEKDEEIQYLRQSLRTASEK